METPKNLKTKFYSYLLDSLSKKDTISLNEFAIIYSENKYIIVNKKYEKICNYLMTKYLNSQSKKKFNFAKFLSIMLVLGITRIFNTENDLAVESNIELQSFDVNTKIFLADFNNEIVKNIKYIELVENNKEEMFQNAIKLYELNQELERQSIYDNYLKEYCSYSNMDSEKVIKLARKTTNDYNDFTKIIKNNDFDLSNPEACCMLFVYFLKKDELLIKLIDLNINKEDLIISNEIRTKEYDSYENLFLTNGDKFSVYVGKICDLFNVKDKKIMLSISYSESGIYGSIASRKQNNFAGVSYEGELNTYVSPEEGIIAMCGNFKAIYNDYTLDNLNELAGLYVQGDETISNQYTTNWKENLKSFYQHISENYEFYFDSNEEIIEEDLTLALKR